MILLPDILTKYESLFVFFFLPETTLVTNTEKPGSVENINVKATVVVSEILNLYLIP